MKTSLVVLDECQYTGSRIGHAIAAALAAGALSLPPGPAAQAVRDLVVRAGERAVVRRVTTNALKAVAKRVGVRVSQQAIGKGPARLLPVIGVMGVGAYACCDTAQLAATAIGLFKGDVQPARSSDHV